MMAIFMISKILKIICACLLISFKNTCNNGKFDQVDNEVLENQFIYNKVININKSVSSFYFKNLRTNFGYNLKGSCAYISISSFLAYYDSYMNDDFISTSYEVSSYYDYSELCQLYDDNNYHESPGIKNDKDKMLLLGDKAEMEHIGCSTVSEQIRHYSVNEKMFQFYLMDFARRKGIITDEMLDSYHFELSLAKQVDLLNQYLSYKSDLNKNDSSFVCFMDENTIDLKVIINLVKSGQPVICSLVSGDSNTGHSAIAYDYLSTDVYSLDGLIFNMGVDGLYASSIKNTKYNNIRWAIYFNADNITHECSNNYINSLGKTSCMCKIHQHKNYEYNYSNTKYFDEFQHLTTCEYCDYYHLSLHQIDIPSISTFPSLMKKRCAICRVTL